MSFSEDQIDALTEVVNIGVGRAASSLHSLLEKRIELRVPSVKVCTDAGLRKVLASCEEPLNTSVVQGFKGAIKGRAMLAFPTASGVSLAKMLADDPTDEDELELDMAGVLEELGNIVLNGVLGSLANVFADDFQFSVPELYNGSVAEALTNPTANQGSSEEQTCLVADARFNVADSKISGSLLLAFNTGELGILLDRLCETAGA